MKIIEVIERVGALYPHPFRLNEMVDFCNELGEMLTTNYSESFKTVTVAEGELLPEGVGRENIVRVIKNNKVLERDDLCNEGIFIYPDSERYYLKADGGSGKLEVVYRIPYTPIRCIAGTEDVKLFENGIVLENAYDIRPGDVLTAETDDGVENFTVNEVEVKDDGFYIYGSGSFTQGIKDFQKMIDDVTVLSQPYDRLYIEFLMSKVARFQKDYETENRSLANYNTMLEDFEKFSVRNGKKPIVDKFFNFW